MFDNLGDVARHLQKIGAKLDPPNDPEMANILEQYGVVNRKINNHKLKPQDGKSSARYTQLIQN